MEPIYYTVREETSFGKGSSMTYNGRYDVFVYIVGGTTYLTLSSHLSTPKDSF